MRNQYKLIQQNLEFLQGRKTAVEMTAMIGACSTNTWRKRIKEPWTLTISELVSLADHYKIRVSDIISTDLLRRKEQ